MDQRIDKIPRGQTYKREGLIQPSFESHRVVLLGVGEDSEEEKALFCRRVSEKLGFPHSLLQKVVDRCPMVLKKGLSERRAKSLAGVLASLGARVSLEAKKASPPIQLEFQDRGPHQVSLGACVLGRTSGGMSVVMGRVKNITAEDITDLWVLVQLFSAQGEFLTYEEVPLPFNPLPGGEESPFKVVFEADLPIAKISIVFKNSAGNIIPGGDGRPISEWTQVKWDEGDDVVFSINVSSTCSPPHRLSPPEEGLTMEAFDRLQRDQTASVEGDSCLPECPDPLAEKESSRPLPSHTEGVPSPDPLRLDLPSSDEAERLNVDRSEITESQEKSQLPPWMAAFRNIIDAHHRTYVDPFKRWFGSRKSENELGGPDHALLTILAQARFDQENVVGMGIENTCRVFHLLAKPQFLETEVPSLDGPPFFSGEQWRLLFFRAVPKLRQITHEILDKRQWKALEIRQLIQVIPHVSISSSRKAIRWISELIPEAVTIDFSDQSVFIDEPLYRILSRLGIVNPHIDYFQEENSAGDLKIQAFGRSAFPKDPSWIEAPLRWIGGSEGEGICLPSQPRCGLCPLDSFCPKLCFDFNPSEKGMGHRSTPSVQAP